MLPAPLAPLAAWPQFVAWKIEPRPHPETGALVPTKVPYSPVHGRRASSTDPSDWGTYEQAAALAAQMGANGVGFVFSAADPFFFVDIDHALEGGAWSPLALELCEAFAGAAVEVSQSGEGLHIIGRGTPPAEHRNKNIPLWIELYTKERFVALTGASAIGSVDTDHTAPLAAVAAQYFPPSEYRKSDTWTTEPRAEWRGPEDDEALIALALRSKPKQSAEAAFGGAAEPVSFAQLWNADADALGAHWPGNSGQPYDASSADQALANHLAFWAGGDCERIERLMRQSALLRGKWDDRPDYLETTILKAVGMVSACYSGGTARAEQPPPPPPDPGVAAETGFVLRSDGGIMLPTNQMLHFAGCVYVSGPHRILTPRGERLDKGRFDAVFGGWEFVIGADGKKTTSSAWEAFTLAQAFVPTRADRFCFRPECGAGGIIEQAGVRMANTYRPVDTPATVGDPTPYLDLLRRQLPDARDRAVLLNYMARVVRDPGFKSQWWPVLQGAKGNAKTLHITVLVHAIGQQYCHLPNTEKMVRGGMNFNGWAEAKLFIGLEEVYAADRRAFFEGFKTTVTNRLIPIEGKGIEETTGDNRANGIITTNHRDGVPIDDNERRYAPLFMSQQERADLERDGMTAEYFSDLYDWLFGRGVHAHNGADYGLRVVNHYLRTMPLEAEFDPGQLAVNAPRTSAYAAAVSAGLGRVEQEILEAIEEGIPGFAGGWISSIQLDNLLERRRLSVPRAKRREMLKQLGYDWHPALAATSGRVHNLVKPDDGKPRLFCKMGSIPWLNCPDPASAARAYSRAQSDALSETTQAAFNG